MNHLAQYVVLTLKIGKDQYCQITHIFDILPNTK